MYFSSARVSGGRDGGDHDAGKHQDRDRDQNTSATYHARLIYGA